LAQNSENIGDKLKARGGWCHHHDEGDGCKDKRGVPLGKSMLIQTWFDDLDGRFDARLREIFLQTRQTADGNATITFRIARVESKYSPEVMKRLGAGQLLAIPNVLGVGNDDCFSVYEIADAYPQHYSMLTLDSSQPGAIRNEFMSLIDKDWKEASRSTWIEVVAVPTGYIMKTRSNGRLQFERKHSPALTGSRVHLLNREAVHQFTCFSGRAGEDLEKYRMGYLLGSSEGNIPFTVDLEKLIHYHVGVFAYTGTGKSNLTSMTIRKALEVIPDLKVVVLDVSSEYGISILDVLDSLPSRVVFVEEMQGSTIDEKAEDYIRRHAIPEGLTDKEGLLLPKVKKLFKDEKIRKLVIPTAEGDIRVFRTYEGLLSILGGLAEEKYGSASVKPLIPAIAKMVENFMRKNSLTKESLLDEITLELISDIETLMVRAEIQSNSQLVKFIGSVKAAIEQESREEDKPVEEAYVLPILISEIMKPVSNTASSSKDNGIDRNSIDNSSPRVFVLNLPEADDARFLAADLINGVFRRRKKSFTLSPRVLFVFDEAQEFLPQERRKEDGTDSSSKAVERLLRHGRKYHMHGWISTQRIAHLNTNALQQLHSYFVSTMPRPYDRQLISDQFAISDAFMERTLLFQNGDWLLTSFKATSTQNVPVFFHAINNEIEVLERLSERGTIDVKDLGIGAS
jgi:hypothetical protein